MKNKSRLIIYTFTMMGVLLLLTYGCKKKPLPVINTTEITLITRSTAICGGTISSDGGSIVTNRGVCWSKDTVPEITDNVTSDGTGAGSFTSTITGLTPDTKYFVRAYATNSEGTAYGSTMLFISSNKITDYDGNVYDTVRIGTQVWMQQNLKTTHYRNGDLIPNVTDKKAWRILKTGALCDFENQTDNVLSYGHLYNFYAVVDSRKICPEGWHIPTDAEWNTLTTFLGGKGIAGNQLKEAGTTHWQKTNNLVSNVNGFTALPGGCRGSRFLYMGKTGYWWSATENNSITAWSRYMFYNVPKVSRSYFYKISAFSVRCIKD
jgi:uncharacterized protein (TIGR02145 family)